MASFLTTPKMAPALAARIEASVRGRRGASGGATPRVVSLVRMAVALAIALAAWALIITRYWEHQAIEQTRASLLQTVRTQAASMRPEDLGFVARIEPWLVRFSGPYEGDLISEELRVPAGWRTMLAQPAAYVRGSVGSFTTPMAVAQAAASSTKDAFLLCLLDPPVSRNEKVLLSKVRTAYAGGPLLEDRTPNVRRLDDAVLGLPFFLPPWAARVQGAEGAGALGKLKRELDKAPLDDAKRAAKSSLLIAVMDEPGDGKGPTELDGERSHDVRVGLVDLAAMKVLLRLRKHVDPAWISVNARAQYSSGLDGCALALDVQENVTR